MTTKLQYAAICLALAAAAALAAGSLHTLVTHAARVSPPSAARTPIK